MHDKQATLLLTRPKPQSYQFLAECEKLAGRRLPVVVSPVFRIETRSSVPDLNNYETLIFTSANGVTAVFDNLRGRNVVTVGEATCAIARQAGAHAVSLGDDADALVAQADEIAGPALHCRGAHTRGDVAKRLRVSGVQTDEAILYDQVSQPLNQAAQSLLQSDNLVVAPVFSPRSAKLLSENKIVAEIKVIAMSQAISDAWLSSGTIDVVNAPTAEEMARQTVRHF